jgi:ribosomal protein L11 methyltransferase
MKNDYIELSITVPALYQELFAWKLGDLGYPQMVLSEQAPDIIPENVTIRLYLSPFQTDEIPALQEAMRSFAQDQGVKIELGTKTVAEEDWAHSWKKYWHPQRIGKRFVVKPTWEDYNASPEDLVIELDPKQAFGTGTHPTTQLCMMALERVMPELGSIELFDVGTGTGILAIAALKLGARHVVACDTDPIAVEATIENAQLNGVPNDITALVGGVDVIPGKAPLVVVNILAEVITEIAQPLKDHLCPGGIIIASGIIKEKSEMVKQALGAEALIKEEVMGDWVGLTFRF